ncbi:hypothetical protein RvY_07924 [Ramazzottius varieornatus]|uniref:WD repeat-containing protein 54 beta-propeller domain-containing protein n=1 Tax=Ramazzottius varieornatus TaxID=947166 RepID=A0A1D1VDB0_RAMVA|nr:hypothetical protein RvY_07924 [Ramazzottius varieornatus]
MIQYRSYKNLALPYSASHIPNNFSVAYKDGNSFEFSVIHKYGVITGNQEVIADCLKKPWPTSSSVPTGALALSLVIFQSKTFLFDQKPVLIVLTSRGPFISLSGDLEAFPGFALEELAANAEWSMHICVTVLADNLICIGNCQGLVHVLQLENYSREGLTLFQTVHTSPQSRALLLTADKALLAAADSAGKLWTWYLDVKTMVPILKSVPTGVSTLLNAMELTEVFVILGYANGLLRLMCRDTGSVYADINAHGAAITAMAYSWKAQVLMTVGEDSFIQMWAIDEKSDDCKVQHLQQQVAEDMLLCGVQFLNADGSRFGVVGYDRNEILVFKN